MPANASLDQRIAWHLAHTKACACRVLPAGILMELKRRRIRVPVSRKAAVVKERQPAVLEGLLQEGLRLGADSLEIEYSNGRDDVVAYIGAVGRQIASFPSNTPEALALRRELYASARRPHRFSVDDRQIRIRVQVEDMFGEDAFRITWGGTRGGPTRS